MSNWPPEPNFGCVTDQTTTSLSWRQVSGIDAMPTAGEAAERSLLEAWVSQQSYGTMYHNVCGSLVSIPWSHSMLHLARARAVQTLTVPRFCPFYVRPASSSSLVRVSCFCSLHLYFVKVD